MLSTQSILNRQLSVTVLLSLGLAACSIHRPDNTGSIDTDIQDAAPLQAIDISHITDATPKHEPLSRYGNPESYVVFGQRYHLLESRQGYKQQGIASWYGTKFHGRRTSSGEPYDMYAMTAAHKTLPIPTYAKVTHLDTGKSITVKINDRGPFVDGRIIDLSYVAGRKLGISAKGTGRVEVETIVPDAAALASEPVATRAQTPVEQTTKPLTFASPQTNNLYLQVGIFRERSNAEQLRQDLTRSFAQTHVATDNSSQQTLYRVRIGPLTKDEEAEQLIESLSRQGHKGFRIRVD